MNVRSKRDDALTPVEGPVPVLGKHLCGHGLGHALVSAQLAALEKKNNN
jgi:hypothetical protein